MFSLAQIRQAHVSVGSLCAGSVGSEFFGQVNSRIQRTDYVD